MKTKNHILQWVLWSVAFLMLSSCSASPVMYRVEVLDGSNRLMNPNVFNYVFLKDSVAVHESGAPMLWKEVKDTVRLIGEVNTSVVLLPEIVRTDEHEVKNVVRHGYTYIAPVEKFFRDKPFMKFNRIVIREGKYDEGILNNFRQILQGDFEYRAAYNIYSGLKSENDSLGIFTSGERYKKYRRVNGIENSRYSLRKKGEKYHFQYRTYLPAVSTDGDTVGPLWIDGYLPDGLTRMTEASPDDFIFEYDDRGVIWIHLDSKGAIHDINRPEDIPQADVTKLVERDFPKTGLYNGLSDIRTCLLKKDKGHNINLRTDRCTIMARGFGDDESSMLSARLRNNFVEKNQQAMFQFCLMMLCDIETMGKYNSDMYKQFSPNIYGMNIEEFIRLMNAYDLLLHDKR